MFSKKEKKKGDIDFGLSFLVIAPCFIFFYLDIFWYALISLGCVSALGALLAKLFEKKARYSLPLTELFAFLIAWFIIFSIAYGGVILWEFMTNYFSPSTVITASETLKDVPLIVGEGLVTLPTVSLFNHFIPSLIFLSSMVFLYLIRLYEVHSSTQKVFTDNILVVLSIAAALLPLWGEYYIFSLVFNFAVLVKLGGGILMYKESDSSAGAVGIIYAFVFMYSVSFSLLIKGVVWMMSF